MGFKDLCIFYIVLLWRNKVKLNGFCGFNTSAWIYERFSWRIFFFCFHEASMWSGVEGRLTESVKVLGSSKTFVHF
jgi:hypothetical protein